MSESGLAMAAGGMGGRAAGARLGLQGRAMALCVAGACFGLMGVAAWLQPAAAGHGTHEGLGLPPCAWAMALDKPCMTCGMTTAFAYAADGDLVSSFLTQPFGFVLAVATAATGWGAGLVALTGSNLGRVAQRVLNGRLLWITVGMLLAAWAYKFLTWES